MSRAAALIRTLIAAASFVGGSTVALPCGYEDLTSASNARGILNWTYPDALHVAAAVWSAQRQGILGRDEQPAAVKALLGYHKAVQRLGAFRDGLSVDAGAAPAFSMVLIGPMLWTRYEMAGATQSMTPHVDGPTNGDVVIVTDEPVIAALIEGQMTPKAARELGLMRLYGASAAVQNLASWLDRVPRRVRATAAAIGD